MISLGQKKCSKGEEDHLPTFRASTKSLVTQQVKAGVSVSYSKEVYNYTYEF